MPVQINEVIIRAVVDSEGSTGQVAETAHAQTGNSYPEAEIAERVMEILKEKKER